jgi:hypothetical protein
MFELNRLLDGLPEKVTITFFSAFARFEYALMQCQFLTSSTNGRSANVDWQKLTDALGDAFFAEAAIAVQTLINDPPKKLIVRNGAATFGPRPPVATDTGRLLQYARQVRNNLFHGNKMFAADRVRDERLMRETLWLVEFIMEKLPEVRVAFNEPQANF